MPSATFVVCPACSRLMIGQVGSDGSVYPQPHRCEEES